MGDKYVSDNDRKIDRHVGMRLRLFRLNAKKSQQEVAHKLGLTFQQIQKYERGDNRIASSRLWELCSYFEVEPNDFFKGIDTFKPRNDNIEYKESKITLSRQNLNMLSTFDNIDSPDVRMALAKICEALDGKMPKR